VRILVFHGYLLGGTGSNVYNASLCRALVALGHEVHLLCQERAARELGFVDAVADWDGGALELEVLRDPVRCTVYRPDIAGLLPVYVADRYDGIDARPFPDLDDAELERYVDLNVAAVREVAQRTQPDVALANHLVMGPAILARALGGLGVPYAVKIHGSALEYTVKPHPERFMPYAREGLAGGRGVLVGSRHTAESLWAALGDPELPERTLLGPPGVDLAAFQPLERADAAAAVSALVTELEQAAREHPAVEEISSFTRDPAEAAAALGALRDDDRVVAFVGKLIVSKGIDLLLAAWPLVLAREPRARLLVIGFGAYREASERLVAALADGDLEAVADIAGAGRELEGGPRGELSHLRAFLDELAGDEPARTSYLDAAAGFAERVLFSGRLEHGEVARVLPLAEALVFPSTFPEAFGMVAAEAAACGALPVSAAHSGLREVTEVLAAGLPADLRPLLSFDVGPGAVTSIAERVADWLELGAAERGEAAATLARVAHERFGWDAVAETVIAAAQGELAGLPRP
jgi:glycosyltransferase involved in cell wall biosynthesis